MTKQDLQKELLEKVKPGTKPSDLKKLKRSKSADDIPKAPPLPHSTPNKEISQLQAQVQFHSQTAANYLKSLQISQAKVSGLETDLSVVKAFNKDLQEQLKNKSLSQLEESDQSLIARHQNLKDWWKQFKKNQKLDQELVENVEEASQELISQDQTISQLRGQISQLKLTNQSLTKDLNLATKLAELRKNPLPTNTPTNLKAFLIIGVVVITWLLVKNN